MAVEIAARNRDRHRHDAVELLMNFTGIRPSGRHQVKGVFDAFLFSDFFDKVE